MDEQDIEINIDEANRYDPLVGKKSNKIDIIEDK